MKEIKAKNKNIKTNGWVLPGTSLSQDEFIDGIRKAEKGPFHSIQESMRHFEQWLKSREKK